MAAIKSTYKDKIFRITLASNITNPINLETTRALLEALSEVSEVSAKGLLLTSDNTKFFSIGFDVPRLLELDEEGMAEFYTSFNELCLRLYSLPIPTLSAIPGHCIAAGCILAACTDYRFMVSGKAKIGVTATKLGLPVPFLSDLIVRTVFKEEFANELLSTGDLYDITWAKNSGFIDEIKAPKTLLEDSLEFLVNKIKHIDNELKEVKTRNIELITKVYHEYKESDADNFISKWFSSEVQTKLLEAKKKF